MKSSTVFWSAIMLQCLGAVALNVVYSKSPFFDTEVVSATESQTASSTLPATPDVSSVPSAPSDLGVTPLMQSAGNGNCEEVLRLLNEGAPVNAVNANGTDALIYAASAGHLACVNHLLRAKARTDTVDRDGDSALSAAQQQGHTEIVETIEKSLR
jgi:ankyrin repeat protein